MDPKGLIARWREKAVGERDPFALLRREMNTLFDDFASGADAPMAALEGFMPRVDVKELDGEIRVSAEVPGVEEKDLDIAISGQTMTIKGEKKQEKEEKGEERYRLERSYGAFRRAIALPCEVDADKARATYKKGVLSVVLPKTQSAAKRKTIAVKAV